MAEPVSSIITIATLGLAVAKECARYIEAVRKVDTSVDHLLEEITRLHGMVRHVKSTYHKVGPDESNESSILVRDKIALCRTRLRQIKPKVVYLASLGSETVMEKAILKVKLDEVTKDIELAVQDINNYMADITTLFNCWTFEVALSPRCDPEASHNGASEVLFRRVSETGQSQLSPCQSRSLSLPHPNSVAGDDLAILVRTNSTTESETPRPTSRFSQSPFDDAGSVSSAPSSFASKNDEDWQNFHFKISKCMDDEYRIGEIRSMLEKAPALANIPGECRRVPLHVAAIRGLVQVARVLVEFGADINAKDTEPSTVLDHAVANKQTDFVAFLLLNGVDETAILERNKNAFKDSKRIVELENGRRDSVSSRESHRFSFFGRRQKST